MPKFYSVEHEGVTYTVDRSPGHQAEVDHEPIEVLWVNYPNLNQAISEIFESWIQYAYIDINIRFINQPTPIAYCYRITAEVANIVSAPLTSQ